MKKSENKKSNSYEDSVTVINTTLIETRLLKSLVEKLAGGHYDTGYRFEKVQPGHKAIETSSLEAYVSGDMEISYKNGLMHMLFVTCFLFTCTKAAGTDYDLTWVRSLS